MLAPFFLLGRRYLVALGAPGITDEQRLRGQHDELAANPPKLIILGDDQVGMERKQRYMNAL